MVDTVSWRRGPGRNWDKERLEEAACLFVGLALYRVSEVPLGQRGAGMMTKDDKGTIAGKIAKNSEHLRREVLAACYCWLSV
jgi:hypothetical protein